MAYNRKNYLKRAKAIQEIVKQYYEPENQAKCMKAVWRKYIHNQFGMCYMTFLKYCKANTSNIEDEK